MVSRVPSAKTCTTAFDGISAKTLSRELTPIRFQPYSPARLRCGSRGSSKWSASASWCLGESRSLSGESRPLSSSIAVFALFWGCWDVVLVVLCFGHFFLSVLFLSPLAHVLFCFFSGCAKGASLVVGFVAEWAAWGEPTDCAGVGARVCVVALFAAFDHDISCLVRAGLLPGWHFLV